MDDKTKQTFGTFIVWTPTGEAPPKVSHPTHKAAHWAAQMLAKKNPGVRFFVMKRSGNPIAHLESNR